MELKAIAREPKQKLPEGYVPAVAYNKDRNVSFAVDAKAFDRAFRVQSTHGLIDIAIEGGETIPALVKSVQMDKRRRTVMHADFYLVTYGQEIEVPVPVHTTGKARGVIEGGILDIVVHNLQIVAPGPRRIPAEIVVDVTELNIGDSIKAGDITLPEGCRLAVDADVAVVAVVPPQKIVEADEDESTPLVPSEQTEE
jgi:large subunit ribosomal protein L25